MVYPAKKTHCLLTESSVWEIMMEKETHAVAVTPQASTWRGPLYQEEALRLWLGHVNRKHAPYARKVCVSLKFLTTRHWHYEAVAQI